MLVTFDHLSDSLNKTEVVSQVLKVLRNGNMWPSSSFKEKMLLQSDSFSDSLLQNRIEISVPRKIEVTSNSQFTFPCAI
jgi:hypothetical protein